MAVALNPVEMNFGAGGLWNVLRQERVLSNLYLLSCHGLIEVRKILYNFLYTG